MHPNEKNPHDQAISTTNSKLIINHNEFEIERVPGDGDCGFHAYGNGMNRALAAQLLNENLHNPAVTTILKLLFSHSLQESDYISKLLSNLNPKLRTCGKLLSAMINAQEDNNPKLYAALANIFEQEYLADHDVLKFFINYDLIEKNIENGFVHPYILYALAIIQGKNLRIFEQNADHTISPMAPPPNMPVFKNSKDINLLYQSGIHFDRLKFEEWATPPNSNQSRSVATSSVKHAKAAINTQSISSLTEQEQLALAKAESLKSLEEDQVKQAIRRSLESFKEEAELRKVIKISSDSYQSTLPKKKSALKATGTPKSKRVSFNSNVTDKYKVSRKEKIGKTYTQDDLANLQQLAAVNAAWDKAYPSNPKSGLHSPKHPTEHPHQRRK